MVLKSTNGGLGGLNSKISHGGAENGDPFGEELPNRTIYQSKVFWWSSNGGKPLEGWKSSRGGGNGGWRRGVKWGRNPKTKPTLPFSEPFSTKLVTKPVEPVLDRNHFGRPGPTET